MRLAAPPARAQRLGQLANKPTQLRAVDRLIDRLRHQVPVRLVAELLPHRPADLLRAPPLGQPLGHERSQHRVVDQLAAAGACPPLDGQPLRGERPIPPTARIPITAQLPTDRRRVALQLAGDRAHRAPGPAQIGYTDPLILRQVTRRDLPSPHADHSWIVTPAPVPSRDCAPQPPACPGLAIDTDQLTRPPIAHPLSDQPSELFTLLHIRGRTPPTTTRHSNSRTPPVLRRWLETAPSRWGQLRLSRPRPLAPGLNPLAYFSSRTGSRASQALDCSELIDRKPLPRKGIRDDLGTIPTSEQTAITRGWASARHDGERLRAAAAVTLAAAKARPTGPVALASVTGSGSRLQSGAANDSGIGSADACSMPSPPYRARDISSRLLDTGRKQGLLRRRG